MTPVDPSQFYTGLVAELYAPLRSSAPEPEPYARFIAHWGEPALELGCGDGDPLLELRARGVNVEGLDSSPDMLARCRRTAVERGLDVVLHEQAMQSMALDTQYRSIYIAGPTFNLLPDDDSARRALIAIRMHLTGDGAALIPLMIPEPTAPDALGRARIHTTADGREMRVIPIAEQRDETTRCQVTTLHYELITPSGPVVEERPWLLHWHTPEGFVELATEAGLAVRPMRTPAGTAATAADPLFVAVVTAAPV